MSQDRFEKLIAHFPPKAEITGMEPEELAPFILRYLKVQGANSGEFTARNIAALRGTARPLGGQNIIADGMKLMGEILSNVSKTRSEISMTFARNSRA